MSGNYNQGQRRGYKPKFKRPRKPPGFGNHPPQQGFWSQPQQGFWNPLQQGYWMPMVSLELATPGLQTQCSSH